MIKFYTKFDSRYFKFNLNNYKEICIYLYTLHFYYINKQLNFFYKEF